MNSPIARQQPGGALNELTFAVERNFEDAIQHELGRWDAHGIVRRLWRRDKSVWTGADEDSWLGWLDSVEEARTRIRDYEDFANGVKRDGFTDAIVLGMGGSSLGPEVLSQIFGTNAGWPALRILDTTDPEQIRSLESAVDIARTLFIVSSKSGSTTEPNVLKNYFFARVTDALGSRKAGDRFVAVTDPGTSLEKTAGAKGFRRVFHGSPDIGGRYSVLSPFGLVPAAAAGINIARFLEIAQMMVRACGPDQPPADNPGVRLGVALGIAARQGRDKITLLCSPRVTTFGAWAEQLIAESTGKDGRGLIPIDGEPLAGPDLYGKDRVFIDLRTEGEADPAHDRALDAVRRAGHPLARIVVRSPEYIGQEFFRFEFAIAVASAIMGINPFDQPDVEASKVKTRELTAASEKTGALPREAPVARDGSFEIYADVANTEVLKKAGAGDGIVSWLKAHFARIHAGDYAAILAYLARNDEHGEALQKMRLAIQQSRHVATCLGFGPRFLHSTGQAYKGGPNSGVFLQITADHLSDLAVPGQAASFGVIEAAQARGDFDVLAQRGRRALRVHLRGGPEASLAALAAAVERALI